MPGETADYHRQYEEGAFLESLAATRRRQAALIIGLIARHLPGADRLLDFGTGRGWFLEACRQAGYADLVGADTSMLAIESLKARGFATLPLVAGRAPDFSKLPFRPRILTLLDVIEHFPPPDLRTVLGGLLQGLSPELELVVIKVPSAGGVLYRTAAGLARAGAVGPIEQLYQVGTSPPHLSYFTSRSMGQLLQLSRMSLLEERGDRDFEPDTLADRARPLRRLPKGAAWLAGSATGILTNLTGTHDATIYVARPNSP